jgi:hypothetical protein
MFRDTETGHGLESQRSTPGMENNLSSPQRLDQLWGSHALLSIGYRGLFYQR